MGSVGTAPAGKTLIGTGNTSSPTFSDIGTQSGLTAHGIVLSQGTSAFTSLAPGATAGQIVQSAGAASNPIYSTATYPSTATSTGTILRADGTNWSATTATYPNTTTAGQLLYSSASNTIGGLTSANNGLLVTGATGTPSILAGPGTTGNILQSNAAAAPSFSTATFPSTATSTGTILRADGTNWVATTATYPNTTTINQLLYSSSANTIGGLSTANNGLLVTSSGGVPSILAGPGTTGNMLQSNAAAAPSFSTATFPSTATSTGTILRANGTNWVATTATYPATTTANQILYSSATNTISEITAANNGVLVTSSGGVPSILAGPGASGKVLQSNAAAAPSYSTPTYPSASGTSGKVLVSDGTNNVYSTPTFPNASATSGKIIISDGTNWIASTPTFPNSASSTGTILRADGTNWAATTATYPNTTTSQQILYSTANNVIGQLTTANSAIAATNSSGTLAMRALSVVTQVFTSSGTYTPTSGMLYCVAECVGGGGGGGGTAATSGSTVAGAGGGGGGGYSRKTFSAATIGASQTVTIGAAGTAGSAGANNGGTGGTTSLGALLSAAGGVGGLGAAASSSSSTGNGGAGGAGASGDFNTTGTPGGQGIAAISLGIFSFATGGFGGSSFFGGGAVGANNAAGSAGTTSGGGGAGAGSLNVSNAAFAGGAGVKGIVVITEYVIA